ncbi:hypothetical protein ACWDX6_24015 [Streptomyces sp. NPDC003027]
MALFLVSRMDRTNYDEYDAIVVRAGDEATALKIATNGEEDRYGDEPDEFFWEPDFRGFERDGSNLTVERVADSGTDRVVLKSFNAG